MIRRLLQALDPAPETPRNPAARLRRLGRSSSAHPCWPDPPAGRDPCWPDPPAGRDPCWPDPPAGRDPCWPENPPG
jgi:hypothetical protein